MKLFSLLIAVVAVVAAGVHARAVPATTTTEVVEAAANGRCHGFAVWTHACTVVEDLTRIVIDIPRTVGFIEDAAIQAAFQIADLLVTPEYLGEAIQAFIAVQLDSVFWVPKAVWGAIETVIDGSHNLVEWIKRLTKQHIMTQIKIIFVEPIHYIQVLLHSSWAGIKAGFEASGMGKVVEWVEKLEAKFNQYVVKPILHFLDFMGGHFKCTTLLPDSICTRIWEGLAQIDWMYVQAWTDFWDFMDGPGWGIMDFLRSLIRPIIHFIDGIPAKLEAFCEARSSCMHFVKVVKKIDKFARIEVGKGARIGEAIVLWIKKHIFEDVEMIAPAEL